MSSKQRSSKPSSFPTDLHRWKLTAVGHHGLRLLQPPGPVSPKFLWAPTSGQAEGAAEGSGGNGNVAERSPPQRSGRQGPAYLRVHGLVLLQAHRVPEGLAAHLARKWSRAAVGPAHVHLQPVRCGEHLGASGAREKAAEGGGVSRGVDAGGSRAGGAGAGLTRPGAREPHLAAFDAFVGAAA